MRILHVTVTEYPVTTRGPKSFEGNDGASYGSGGNDGSCHAAAPISTTRRTRRS